MAGPGLSGTWFQSNGTQEMLVEDAYKISTNQNRNTQYDSVKGIYGGAIEGLYTNKGSARTLLDLLKQSKSGSLSKSEMLDRALSAMGSSLPSLLGSLGGALAARLSETAGSLFGDGAAQTVALLYKNLPEKLIKADRVTDYQDMAQYLTEITGDSDLMKLMHVEAESAILGAMAGELMSFGVPSMVDDAINTSASEEVRRNAYTFVSTSAVKGSDLVMVNNTLDQIGLVTFTEANPNAVNEILNVYYLGTDDTPEVFEEKRDYLVQTLVRVNPYWDMYLRNGVYIPNLEPYSVASTDAKKLFMLHDPQRTYLLASESYKAQTARSVLTSTYPTAFFS